MIKRKDILGEEGPVLIPENSEDAQFMFTYTSCMKQFLEEIKGLGQDQINALFDKYKIKLGVQDGRPIVGIDYPGGVPDWIQKAAKEYAKEFK